MHLQRHFLVALLLLVLASSAFSRGPWRASDGNTSGWSFMSPEERVEHQARIRSFKTWDECHNYRLEHHRLMEARARERGMSLAPSRRDICEHLRRPAPER